MQILGRFCLLIVVCSVLELYERFLQIFVGLFLMACVSFFKSLTPNCEFGCGLFVFGCFSQVFNILGLVFMFCLGLKVLQFSWHGNGLVQYLCGNRVKSSDLKNGVCLRNGFDQVCDPKISSLKFNALKNLEKFKAQKNMSKELVIANIDVMKKDAVEEEDDDAKEFYNEDQEYDVLALRRLVKIERHRAYMAHLELEKEQVAAASAAEEAMAMILRLQREKSSIEIETNQYRRMAEQKHDFDQEVIQSLQWIVMKHESERSELEEQLKLCEQKLKTYVKEDDMDQFEEVDARKRLCFSTADDGLIRSLDMDSSDL